MSEQGRSRKPTKQYVAPYDMRCEECEEEILAGEQFAVVSTPSKPYKNNCLACAEARLTNERHAKASRR